MVVKITNDPIQCNGDTHTDIIVELGRGNGRPVEDGIPVQFNVTALGTANPIVARTKDGIAVSEITPLRGASAVSAEIRVAFGDAPSQTVPVTIHCSPAAGAR